ncbi:MAG: hypothetical protein COA43_15500 [Robiginitomaculum sp.]|nr:MAG: hypothetical protein COA43_15500 [Robiginitomaculum sp.]
MNDQLPLDLAVEPDYSVSAFLRGTCNQEAWVALTDANPLAANPWANRVLALVGPLGSGKTHLGHIWAERQPAIKLDGLDKFKPKREWRGRSLWIDNAASADEFTLFTLINLAITSDIEALLLTDRSAPSEWDVQIPDLHSRLRNVQTVKLSEPDDDVLMDIVDKLFKDRGLRVSMGVIQYLVANTDRSVNALRVLIVKLDEYAAQEKINVTRSFVAKFLQNH